MSDERPRFSGGLIAANTLLNLAGRLAPILVALGTMPFVVRGLGPERFGLFSIGWGLIGFFFIFDLGMGRAATRYVSEALAQGRTDDVPRVAWNAALFQAIVGLAGGTLLALVAPWSLDWLSLPPELADEALRCFFLLAATVPLALMEFTFAGVLESLQRFDQINAVRAPLNIAVLLLLLSVAVLGLDLSWFFAAYLAVRLLNTVTFLLLAARAIPGLLARPRFERVSLARLFRFGKWVTISNLLNPVFAYFDRLWLGHAVDLRAVSHYTGPYQVAERALIIPATLASTLFPAVAGLDGAGDLAAMRALSMRATKLLALGMGLCIVWLVGASGEVVRLFLGADYLADSPSILQLLCCGFFINALAFVPDSIVQGRDRPDITALFHLLELPIHLGALAVFVHSWGAFGAALAFCLRVSLDTVLLYWYAAKLGGFSASEARRGRLPQMLAGLLLAGLCALALSRAQLDVLPRLGLVSGLTGAAALALWRCCLHDSERDEIRGFVRTLYTRILRGNQ